MRSMKYHGLFIIIIMLICSISVRLSTATTSTEGDYDDDYIYDDDYDYDSNTSTPKEDDYAHQNVDEFGITENKTVVLEDDEKENVSTTIQSHDNKTEFVQIAVGVIGEEIVGKDVESIDETPCPNSCICKEQLQFIDCSNQSLSDIPKNLPNNSLEIDLSNNNIEVIPANAFSNLVNLSKLILRSNRIQSIDKTVFQGLDRLELIDLTSNNISKIDPDTFSYALGLHELSLNNNPIVLEANQTFLNLPQLKELNMVGCNISELFYENFVNFNALTSLNLANNSFAENINVTIFHPISSLLKLKIPHVSREVTYELCDKLTVIDVISFDNYNISCFELISGSSYDESTITHGPPTTTRMETTELPIQQTPSTEPVVATTPTTNPPKQNTTEITDSYRSTNATVNISPRISPTLNTTSADVNSERVEESTISIKTILIGSIVVAVIGLAIGLICRKDVFGVKTKLCRTQRPEPVTIPEQVPLNKV